ncbi:MAG TPA: substrate-binding domain-containing protein [Rariglobus sp.]|nr:substrate-binding domain-containing protein [Rariglobus sp.]
MPSGNRVDEAEARLREWLASLAPKRGARLPSERTLTGELGLKHYALNRAMGRLLSEGLVSRDGAKLFAGAGTIVTPDHSSLSCHLVVAHRSIYIPSYRKIAKEMGIKLIIHTWRSSEEVILNLEQLDVRETEAVIFDPPYWAPATLWEPIVNRLCKHGIPVICLGQVASNLFSVLTDNLQALELAILHLSELGHREFGLVAAPPINPLSAEILQAWDALCRKHGLTESIHRIHLQNHLRLKEDADEVADLVLNRWRPITALIVVAMPECNIQLLQERLAHKECHLPRDLSLLLVGEAKSITSTTPPVTAVGFDMANIQAAAFFLAQRAVTKRNPMGILPPSYGIRIQSQLMAGQSTGPVNSPGVPTKKYDPPTAPNLQDTSSVRFKPATVTLAAMEACLRKAYPLAARAFLSELPRFTQVDLKTYVNRPLNFRRGWLGDLPLKQLTPGLHEIHGVPFQILGGPKRSDCGSIVFHSAVNTTGNSKKLPDKIKIPIGSKAQAVYILHGCGYAKFLHTFAHYSFHNRATCLDRVPLISLGQPPPDYNCGQSEPITGVPNIQDWWPDFPHTDYPHARMAPLLDVDNASHVSRHVYLYSLEWINPSPQTVVSHLEITVDSTHSTTLGVLAVTVLKP